MPVAAAAGDVVDGGAETKAAAKLAAMFVLFVLV
jgi:hypothetical protein